ncbi:MAG TPA: M10 family metallopeptidase C-terminal domain-containing protein [Allosphingosinicella sp.]|nr:M10 family metallopeptidase C-terminal domain-containing protein [Allosphingosinicella sp.]
MPESDWTLEQIVANLTRDFTPWQISRIGFTFVESSTDPNFVTFSNAQRAAVKTAFELIADVTNLNFYLSADDGDYDGEITFENQVGTGVFGYGGGGGTSGAVTIDADYVDDPYSLGGWTFSSLMHEIGHALSLSHPGLYNASDLSFITYGQDALYTQDSEQYTVMSYFGAHETGADHQGSSASTPLLHDIAALQSLYGANVHTRLGNTVYGFGSNAGRLSFDFGVNLKPVVAIWDAGGTDSVNLSQYTAGCRVDLRQGAFSDVGGLTQNLAICFGTIIENVVGGKGNDRITGNSIGNTVSGGLGDDTLYGLEGNDILNGGAGNDILDGSTGGDVLIAQDGVDRVFGGDGADRIRFSPAALTSEDLVLGGAGVDTLELDGAGVISVGQLSGVAGVEKIVLATGTNSIVLTDGLIARSDGVTMTVVGGGGKDRIDASGVSSSYGLQLVGGPGDDVLLGGRGATLFVPGRGSDQVVGQDGDDRVEIRVSDLGATDSINGGWGYNALVFVDSGTVSAEQLSGLNRIDKIYLGNGRNNISINNHVTLAGLGSVFGSSGSDFLNAASLSGGQSILFAGGEGDDVFKGGSGDDSFFGEEGNDTVDYRGATSRVLVDLSIIDAQEIGGGQGRDLLRAVETVEGSAFNDLLKGNSDDNVFVGNGGNDTLEGGAGTDTASYRHATAGVSVSLAVASGQLIAGGQGTDTLKSIESLEGSNFNDELKGNSLDNVLTGGAGNDILRGAAGKDTAAYATASAGVRVNLSLAGWQAVGADQGSDALFDIEDLVGSGFADQLTGSAGDNMLSGGAGDDVLAGSGGADTLIGGNGSDTLDGGDGADSIEDGDGNDVVRAGDGDDAVWDGAGDDRLSGGTGNDSIFLSSGRDFIDGGSGQDSIYFFYAKEGVKINLASSTSQDIGVFTITIINVEDVTGTDFKDSLLGNQSGNRLNGYNGDDILGGLGGNDTLEGGRGRDITTGGPGADGFFFWWSDDVNSSRAQADVITDFHPAEGDHIYLLFDANENTAGEQKFSFVGTAAFSGTAGELRYDVSSGNAFLQGDTDGNGSADFFIRLDGVTAIAATDLVL